MSVADVLPALFFLAVAWLACSNGANDNFKGVATLFGSRTTGYRQALWLAMASTLLGSLTAILLARELIVAFSGKGLVDAAVLDDPAFLLAVAAGAAATVLLATRTGFPISTTHALIGALIGASLLVPGGADASRLVSTFLLPLVLTPLAAVAVTFALYAGFRRARLALGVSRETCVCLGEAVEPVALESPMLAVQRIEGDRVMLRAPDGTSTAKRLQMTIDSEPHCIQRYHGRLVGLSAQRVLNGLHYLSAGAVGFARGLQDTAKIVGLLVGAGFVGLSVGGELFLGVAVVGVCMALGGMLGARRVAETMSHDLTDMNSGQGFTANLVTSSMVIGTALAGMPVSTTHCSVGSILGIGMANRTGRWRVARQVLLAWVVTLPVAAVLALAAFSAVRT